jgi:hypothetical protein
MLSMVPPPEKVQNQSKPQMGTPARVLLHDNDPLNTLQHRKTYHATIYKVISHQACTSWADHTDPG